MIRRTGVAILCVAVLMLESSCGRTTDNARSVTPVLTVSGVTIAPAAAELVPDEILAVGSVRPRNVAQIAARIAGTVSSLYVKEGDTINRGMLLLTLKSSETTAGAASARAEVEQARNTVEEARSRRQFSDQTFERYQKLLQEEAVTRQEYDGKVAEKEVAAKSLARAEAALVAAQEGARGASALAGYAKIYAPLAGVVAGKFADVGMTVFPGTQLLIIEGQQNYRLEVAAPESLLGKVHPGDRVPITLEGMATAVTGIVEEVAPVVDRMTRTFTVKIGLAGKALRSGTYGEASFAQGKHQGILISEKALSSRGALQMVWVVDKDRIVRMRVIKTGKRVGNKVEVLAGLAAGEAVVVDGQEKIVEGARIEESSSRH